MLGIGLKLLDGCLEVTPPRGARIGQTKMMVKLGFVSMFPLGIGMELAGTYHLMEVQVFLPWPVLDKEALDDLDHDQLPRPALPPDARSNQS